MRELTFGYSPCPNDTFAFHALAHGLVDAPCRVRPVLLDIEELNRRARDGEFHLTKLSVGAFAGIGDGYRLLRSGAALGRGVGPLVVTRTPMTLAEAVSGRIAIPGRDTTAYRLLRLAAPITGEVAEMRYDRILQAVSQGDVAAGLIIHESRFTYEEHGLVRAADLGDWWERETGLAATTFVHMHRRCPRPCARRTLPSTSTSTASTSVLTACAPSHGWWATARRSPHTPFRASAVEEVWLAQCPERVQLRGPRPADLVHRGAALDGQPEQIRAGQPIEMRLAEAQ
jgi:hypothetical protein